MLPPGTLTALKGQYDGIVTVVALAVTLAALAAGAVAWAALMALAIALAAFHIRRLASERHREDMAQARIAQEVARVDAIKAGFREGLDDRQARLRFPAPSPRRPGERDSGERGGQ